MTSQLRSIDEHQHESPAYSLTPDEIREFQEILREETGVELSADDA